MAITNTYSFNDFSVDASRDNDSDFGANRTFSMGDANLLGSSSISNSYVQYHNNQFGASTRFSTNTQRVVQGMVTEAINHNGITVRYMPRLGKYAKTVFNETPEILYHRGMQIDVLLEGAMGFDGLGTQLTNIGLQFNQEVTLKMSISRYDELYQTFLNALTDSDSKAFARPRPLEGDIVVIPFGRSAHNKNQYFPKFFEITECTTFMDASLFQLGDNFQFDIRARLFDLSAEDLEFMPVVQEYGFGVPIVNNLITNTTVQEVLRRATTAYTDSDMGFDSENATGNFRAFADSDHWDSYADNEMIETRAQKDEIWDNGKAVVTQDVMLDDLTSIAFGVKGALNNLDDI